MSGAELPRWQERQTENPSPTTQLSLVLFQCDVSKDLPLAFTEETWQPEAVVESLLNVGDWETFLTQTPQLLESLVGLVSLSGINGEGEALQKPGRGRNRPGFQAVAVGNGRHQPEDACHPRGTCICLPSGVHDPKTRTHSAMADMPLVD